MLSLYIDIANFEARQKHLLWLGTELATLGLKLSRRLVAKNILQLLKAEIP